MSDLIDAWLRELALLEGSGAPLIGRTSLINAMFDRDCVCDRCRDEVLCRAFADFPPRADEPEPGYPVELPCDVEPWNDPPGPPPGPPQTATEPPESETDRIWSAIKRAAGG